MSEHKRCGERLGCPCWMDGAREEGEMHRTRVTTRQLTDYIRALGDNDPAMTTTEVADAVARVYGTAAAEAAPPSDPDANVWAVLDGQQAWRDALSGDHAPHRGNHEGYACGFSGPHCWACGEPWPCRAERGVTTGPTIQAAPPSGPITVPIGSAAHPEHYKQGWRDALAQAAPPSKDPYSGFGPPLLPAEGPACDYPRFHRHNFDGPHPNAAQAAPPSGLDDGLGEQSLVDGTHQVDLSDGGGLGAAPGTGGADDDRPEAVSASVTQSARPGDPAAGATGLSTSPTDEGTAAFRASALRSHGVSVTHKSSGFRTAPMKDGIRYDDKGQPIKPTALAQAAPPPAVWNIDKDGISRSPEWWQGYEAAQGEARS